MTFEFDFNWIENRGVKDSRLAATWGDWRCSLNGKPIVQFLDRRSRSVRANAFCSALPIAEWLVENWWFIFGESTHFLESSSLPSGKELARNSQWHSWVKRHNFLSIGEGMPVPDCFVIRDGDRIRFCWFSDQMRGKETSAVEFLSQGDEYATIDDVRAAFSRFIDSTVQRLHESGLRAPESMASDWAAIKGTSAQESFVCIAAAALGLHPYCDLSDEIENRLAALERFPESAILDFLAVTTSARLPAELDSIVAAIDAANRFPGKESNFSVRDKLSSIDQYGKAAYQVGYERARQLRECLGLDWVSPIENVGELFAAKLSWPVEQQAIQVPVDGKAVSGIILCDSDGIAKLAGPTLPRKSMRFRAVRGAGALLDGVSHPNAVQLLTYSGEWRQRVGRAFAAEFLAPHKGILEKLPSDTVFEAEISQIADYFDVDFQVIKHQIENHKLATIAEL